MTLSASTEMRGADPVICTAWARVRLYPRREPAPSQSDRQSRKILVRKLLEVGDDVLAIIVVLQTSERHLVLRYELPGILEVLRQGFFVPHQTLFACLLHGGGVVEALGGRGVPPDDAIELRPDGILGVIADLMAGTAFPE